jgi:hypothetical protein
MDAVHGRLHSRLLCTSHASALPITTGDGCLWFVSKLREHEMHRLRGYADGRGKFTTWLVVVIVVSARFSSSSLWSLDEHGTNGRCRRHGQHVGVSSISHCRPSMTRWLHRPATMRRTVTCDTEELERAGRRDERVDSADRLLSRCLPRWLSAAEIASFSASLRPSMSTDDQPPHGGREDALNARSAGRTVSYP